MECENMLDVDDAKSASFFGQKNVYANNGDFGFG